MPIDRFPARTHPLLQRVKRWGLTDGFALLLLGVGILLRGVAYTELFPPLKDRHPAEEFISLDVWGLVWIVVGVLCIGSAARPSSRVARWGLAAAVALMVLWGASYIGDSIAARDARRWTQSIGYLTIALMTMWTVWRGHRHENTEGEERV